MEQETSGKVGSRTIGFVAEGRLLRVSKENNLLRFATYTITEDKTSFDKLSAFKHQQNKNATQLSLLGSEYVFNEDKARHTAVALILQKIESTSYYTLISYDHEGRLSTIFDIPVGEFKVENCDVKIFDGPVIYSINRKQGLVHVIQRDPATTIWEQFTIDPLETVKSDKVSSKHMNMIDIGLYDSHTSVPQLLFACKLTAAKSTNKSRRSNGHRNNNTNNTNNNNTNMNTSSDDMDIDQQDPKSAFWEKVNRSGLLKSSTLNALFNQRTENLLDPWHLYLLPLEKEATSVPSTLIPSLYLHTCCIAHTYWDTLGQEFTLAGTENGSVMLIEQGRLKNSVALGSKPNKISFLRNSAGEQQIAVQSKDGKVSLISKKSFAVVKEYSKTALMAVDDFTNSFSEQILIVFKKDATDSRFKTLFPFIFIDGPNEYSNFKDNIVQTGSQDSSRSTLLSVSHSLQSRLRIASENLSVMEQRIKDKKETFVQACNLLEQIMTSVQQTNNPDAESTKCIHINELNCSSEFLENKLSLHFSLDVTNASKSPVNDCQLILHSSTSTRSTTFAVNIQPNAKSQLNGTLYLEEIPSQSSSEISVNITAQFLLGQHRAFEHLSTVKLKPEDLFTLQKMPNQPYSCSVAVESKIQAVDHMLFDVLKHKLKLKQSNESTWMSEKSNISATTTMHTMTTEVELKAKSEEELLLALQVLCSSLPEDLELSASGLSEGVLELCDQFVTKITDESNIIAKLTTLQKEFEKDKQKNQKLAQYVTSMRQLQRDFIAMQSQTDELYAKMIQLICSSCKEKK